MLMMRKVTLNDQTAFEHFCDKIDLKNWLTSPETFFGVFDGNKLQGVTKIDFKSSNAPLIVSLQTVEHLEPSVIEGLLRGTLHYCASMNYESVVFRG